MSRSPHQGDRNECVSKNELGQLLQELNANILKSNHDSEHRLERIERSIATIVTRMENLEKQPQPPNNRDEEFGAEGINQDEPTQWSYLPQLQGEMPYHESQRWTFIATEEGHKSLLVVAVSVTHGKWHKRDEVDCLLCRPPEQRPVGELTVLHAFTGCSCHLFAADKQSSRGHLGHRGSSTGVVRVEQSGRAKRRARAVA
ncbi:hypothetical protein GUJ93_ZPchr0005g14958 [Zizania palustris]|uniref:Uncharacterized protein n=1 Tax=Zizania palustris TaxID=103762 RepID=A0A8J5SPY9_ZIZPA|nr:hypothetical protein GUJ93_ZPchr0005g14958 [Zizania palustris]